MLRRDADKSVSFQRGFRGRGSLRSGGAFLPFLALMLIAAPQAAFAQEKCERDGQYEFAEHPGRSNRDVHGEAGQQAFGGGGLDDRRELGRHFHFRSERGDTDLHHRKLRQHAADVRVTAASDNNAVDEKVTITHTATVGGKPATVDKEQTTVSVTVDDSGARSVTVNDSTDNATLSDQ